MDIVIWAVIIASLVFGIFVIVYPNKAAQKPTRKDESDKPKDLPENSQKALISALEEQLFSAKDELEKIRAENVNIQSELEATKKRELELREELMRQKNWYDKKVEELGKLKSDYLPLKDKLDKEISQDLNLNKEIQEKDGIIDSLKRKNKELGDEVQALKIQLQKYAS